MGGLGGFIGWSMDLWIHWIKNTAPIPGLVNIQKTSNNHGTSPLITGQSTISLTIFEFANCECLPERISII